MEREVGKELLNQTLLTPSHLVHDSEMDAKQRMDDPQLPDLSFLSPGDEEYVPEISQHFDSGFFNTSDFVVVVKAIVQLQKQRQRIIEERDQLLKERENALADPAKFMENVMNKKCNIPALRSILVPGQKHNFKEPVIECPDLDFQKYENLDDIDGTKKKRKRRSTVPKKSTSQSHGILWSLEEQAKLEELLLKYPDELVSSHRWEKIARELGNRTPKQVASRVQKYFIKLAKAGLPVPGKLPNMENYIKKKKPRTEQKSAAKIMNSKVTIYTSDIEYYAPPPIPMANPLLNTPGTDNPLPNSTLNQTPTGSYTTDNSYERIVEVVHEGFKCSSCGMFPIRGPRWTCATCSTRPQANRKDSKKAPFLGLHLCEKCGKTGYKKLPHRPNHEIQIINHPVSINTDEKVEDEFNYLDPNFMPD
eukprot:TRINITY_DN12209_c0_g1_i1.p1 TRINITY_DN12209_c0_g1~~TRINITY_DN12209_c0_g1_i1.p1  ORF type:complete len:420 (-),score=51.91 TRINITY_DN12209_c0_g1_i1:769-2028(-)